MSGLSASDLLAACAAAQHQPTNTDPAWRTTNDIAREAGQCLEVTRRKLMMGLAGGVVKREKRYAWAGQRVVMVDHWKFVGKAKK